MTELLQTDHVHLARAIEIADGGRGRTSPNPMVGAVVVRDGVVLGEGFHTAHGRAYADPRAVPQALRYYAALERDAKLVYEVRPDGDGKGRLPFSYDFSFNAYPLSYGRMGPEVRIYSLSGGKC